MTRLNCVSQSVLSDFNQIHFTMAAALHSLHCTYAIFSMNWYLRAPSHLYPFLFYPTMQSSFPSLSPTYHYFLNPLCYLAPSISLRQSVKTSVLNVGFSLSILSLFQQESTLKREQSTVSFSFPPPLHPSFFSASLFGVALSSLTLPPPPLHVRSLGQEEKRVNDPNRVRATRVTHTAGYRNVSTATKCFNIRERSVAMLSTVEKIKLY